MNIKKIRRLKKRLKFIMFLSTLLLFTSPLCADETNKEEEITLSTYYPAPYGEYETVTYTPRARPTSPQSGMLYYDNGTGSYAEGLYIYTRAGSWQPVGASASGPRFLGRCELDPPTDDDIDLTHFSTYYKAGTGHISDTTTSRWSIYDFKVPEGGSPLGADVVSVLAMASGMAKCRLDTSKSDELSAGIYQIRWGGGFFQFETGTTVKIKLYLKKSSEPEWSKQGEYNLTNPKASDGTANNFSDITNTAPSGDPSNSCQVSLPESVTSFTLTNDQKMDAAIQIESVTTDVSKSECGIGETGDNWILDDPNAADTKDKQIFNDMKDSYKNPTVTIAKETENWKTLQGYGSGALVSTEGNRLYVIFERQE